MGIFSRRKAAVLAPADWQPDGLGVTDGGDDRAGDIQRGSSYVTGFINDDLPGRVILAAFYAVEYQENPGEFVVQRQVTWRIWDDQGDEYWSETVSDDPMDLVFATADDAERDARETAEDALERADAYGTWDGETFDPEGD